MSNDRSAVINRWFEEYIAPKMALEDHYGEIWHLNQIYGQQYKKPWDINLAVEAFRLLRELTAEACERYDTMLAINLEQTATLTPLPIFSNLSELDIDSHHPPSLIVRKYLHPDVIPSEMYRAIIQVEGTPLADISQHWYYRCYRTQEARELNEPFDRDIVIIDRGCH